MPDKLPSVRSYTIGWIAALNHELLAATCMFDDEHNFPEDFAKHSNDTNLYSLGRIGRHNVVITSIAAGSYGTTAAATTASNMLSSFPHIRIGLMVGIGAGLPRVQDKKVLKEYDIRLGDVVISQPKGISSGVVQYDLGKLTGDKFERVGFLGAPPEVLLKGLNTLKMNHRKKRSDVPVILQRMVEDNPILGEYDPETDSQGFVYQGEQYDRLFDASAPHVDASDEDDSERSCSRCDDNLEIHRDPRPRTNPRFHYGIIASGNLVVKNRDAILQRLSDNCLCIEMEAAGLMNHFPCLVIRGICDYADSHKNDRWQNYAAATAAAYAKELLQVLQPSEVEIERSIQEVVRPIRTEVSQINENVVRLLNDDEWDKVVKWLGAPDPSTNFVAAQRCLNDTSSSTPSWFLESEAFRKWRNGSLPYLWINGIPGCGKTVLASSVLQTLGNRVLYFFFDFSDGTKQSYDGLIRCLIRQLSGLHMQTNRSLKKLWSDHESGSQQVEISRLVEVLERNLRTISTTHIIVDALDECTELRQVLSWLRKLCQMNDAVRLIITSRPLESIKAEVLQWIPDEAAICADGGGTKREIERYIQRRLDEGDEFKDWRSIPDDTWRDNIERTLVSKADGMFRWAALQLNALAACRSLRDLDDTLRELPADLHQTYGQILSKIPKMNKQAAVQLLQFLLYSEGNLWVDEALDLMAVNRARSPHFDPKYRMRGEKDISDTLPGLVKLVDDPKTDEKNVILALAHASVKDYLLSTEIRTTFNHDFSEVTAKTEMVEICISYFCSIGSTLNATPNKYFSNIEVSYNFPLVRHILQLEHTQKGIKYPRPLWMCFLENEDVQKATSQLVSEFLRDETSGYIIFTSLYAAKLSYYYPNIWESQGPIFFAILANNFDYVRVLLKNAWIIHNRASELRHSHLTRFRRPKPVVNLMSSNAYFEGWTHNTSLLDIACERENKRIIELLLNKGANPMERQGKTFTAVCRRSGDPELAKLFLDRGADINNCRPYETYETPLLEACRGGKLEIARVLVDQGAKMTEGGKSELHYAIKRGSLEFVEFLIQQGADVKSRDSGALRLACECGNFKLASLLLNHGADITDEQSFHSACQAANLQTVRLLLDRGANANGVNGFPLWRACKTANVELVQVLLDHGADVNGMGSHSSLERACDATSVEIVQLLLDHGADANGMSPRSPLRRACEAARVDIVQVLLDNGADVNGTSPYSPLESACDAARVDIVQLLLDHGADANGISSHSPLDRACGADNLEMVQLLLNHGANANSTNGFPLKHACHTSNLELIQLLLERGANMNTSPDKIHYRNSPYAESVLVIACSRGLIEIVRLLLDREAMIDTDGQKSLCAAAKSGNFELVQLLLDRGAKGSSGYSEELMAACDGGNSTIAKLFLGLREEPIGYLGDYLTRASARGHSDVVKLLLEYHYGTDVNNIPDVE